MAQTLVQDSLYVLSAKLKLVNPTIASVGSFGAFFSPDSAIDLSNYQSVIDETPQLQRNPDSIMNDANIWYEWQDTLIAIGAERFMLLGNFLTDAQTPYFLPGSLTGSFYFVDEIMLIPIPKPNSINQHKFNFSTYPNPITDNLTIESKTPLAQILLRDLAGRRVLPTLFPSRASAYPFDVSSLPSGVYLVEAVTEDGRRSIQKVVVDQR